MVPSIAAYAPGGKFGAGVLWEAAKKVDDSPFSLSAGMEEFRFRLAILEALSVTDLITYRQRFSECNATPGAGERGRRDSEPFFRRRLRRRA